MHELREVMDVTQTKAAIRREAWRLFSQNGFEATTPEEIAQAAGVSPNVLLELYRTKADIVIEDDLEPLVIAAFKAQPPQLSPITAFRNAIRSVLSRLTPEQSALMGRRATLIKRDSALRKALLTQFGDMVDEVAQVVEGRVGPVATNLAVRNLAGALVRLIMSATLWAADDPLADLVQQTDAALVKLEASLSLATLDRNGEQPETRLVTLRDGRHLAYTEWGSRSGAPIVFQHGMPANPYQPMGICSGGHSGSRSPMAWGG